MIHVICYELYTIPVSAKDAISTEIFIAKGILDIMFFFNQKCIYVKILSMTSMRNCGAANVIYLFIAWFTYVLFKMIICLKMLEETLYYVTLHGEGDSDVFWTKG